MFGLTLGLMMSAAVCGTPPPAHDRESSIELRLANLASLEPEDIVVAERTASDLLSAAGVHLTWAATSATSPCGGQFVGRQSVRLSLYPGTSRLDPLVTGAVVQDADEMRPAIMVFVPRARELLAFVQGHPEDFRELLNQGISLGHIIGLTIAHETGHILGLGHNRQGIMRARVDVNDLLTLRATKLRFARREIRVMRRTMNEFAGRRGRAIASR